MNLETARLYGRAQMPPNAHFISAVACKQPSSRSMGEAVRVWTSNAAFQYWLRGCCANAVPTKYLAPYEAYVIPSSLLGRSIPLLFNVTTALVSVCSSAATACTRNCNMTKVFYDENAVAQEHCSRRQLCCSQII